MDYLLSREGKRRTKAIWLAYSQVGCSSKFKLDLLHFRKDATKLFRYYDVLIAQLNC